MRRFSADISVKFSRPLFTATTARLAVVPFKLADIGEGILKVDVLKVFVKPGDKIHEFDRICEVQSDKATVEITSRYTGVVKSIFVNEGDVALVGSTLVDIETAGAAPAAAIPAPPAATTASPAASASSVVPFKLADIGEGILKVDVLKVFVKPGDKIHEFDRICEVQSDKATVEITSRYTGVINKVYVTEGNSALVGDTLVDIQTEGGSVSSGGGASAATTTAAAPKATPSAAAATVPFRSNGKVLATPSTRRIAKEQNVDLALVRPTGKGGRIMKEDILAFLENGRSNSSAPSSSSAAPTVAPPSSVAAASAVTAADRTIPLTGVRKAMVKSMTEANKIPSFGASDEIEISKLIETRDLLKGLVLARHKGVKLTFMPFFLKAASLALLQFPELNAYTNDGCTELLVKSNHNIGFAMDTPKGLVVPNVKAVETKSLTELALELSQLMEAGKKNALPPAAFQGGTFTLSNIGSIGATYTKPVIFPPQVAIGAIGRMQTLPRFDKDGNVVKANIINVSWSADHRVVDGATMVRFNNLFKQYLEHPATMILDAK